MSTDTKSISWYNENAQAYTAHVRNKNESVFHSLYEKPAMYSLVPDLHNRDVISLGCGSGEDSNYLKSRGAHRSVGIDISMGMVNIASSSYGNCEFKVMDMEKLDFREASFDFAYSSLAIHYIKKWDKVFESVFRILKPKSFFLFSCNHPVLSAMSLTDNSVNKRVLELSINKNKAEQKISVTGNYVQRHTEYDSSNITTWHKPFGEIIKEAYGAGFVLDALVEPMPLKEMEAVAPLDYEQLLKIPEFVIFKLQKPAL